MTTRREAHLCPFCGAELKPRACYGFFAIEKLLTAQLGRSPTADEVKAAEDDGLLLRVIFDPATWDLAARWYAERGDHEQERRHQELAENARARLVLNRMWAS
jgi:hypothetical protein